ncbi:MAG: preprotein translocase subunit SecE [Clostridiales bacterium]|nr:preprotein translocase subunit SecE [Clostridiales bacterium]
MAKGKSSAKTAVKSKKKRKSIIQFFREVISELKKVSWPSTKELSNYTLVVVVVILVFAIITGFFDFGLGKLLSMIS